MTETGLAILRGAVAEIDALKKFPPLGWGRDPQSIRARRRYRDAINEIVDLNFEAWLGRPLTGAERRQCSRELPRLGKAGYIIRLLSHTDRCTGVEITVAGRKAVAKRRGIKRRRKAA